MKKYNLFVILSFYFFLFGAKAQIIIGPKEVCANQPYTYYVATNCTGSWSPEGGIKVSETNSDGTSTYTIILYGLRMQKKLRVDCQ